MSSNVPFDLSTIREDSCEFVTATRPNNLGDIFQTTPKTRTSLTLPTNRDDSMHVQFEHVQSYSGLGLEILSSVVGSLIGHPCVVLRRQCQVNRKALRYHLSPFSLVSIIIKLQNRQGVKTLWKGAGGIFILRGFTVAIETVISEITPFPREISFGSSLKHVAQHLLLKSITFAILTPFYCSSLIETVQSDVASEKPGVFDCLREGIRRLFRWGTPQSTRLLPIWKLVGPTIGYGIMNYIISSLVQSVFTWIVSLQIQREYAKHGAIHKDPFRAASSYFDSLSAAYFGHMIAEVLLFPAETVLNRLYLQGTRTIVDNLDTGLSVIPVISKYEGAVDCFHTIVEEEGSMGLYKGFGALVLEYSLQMLILKTSRFVFQEVSSIFSSSKGCRAKT